MIRICPKCKRFTGLKVCRVCGKATGEWPRDEQKQAGSDVPEPVADTSK